MTRPRARRAARVRFGLRIPSLLAFAFLLAEKAGRRLGLWQICPAHSVRRRRESEVEITRRRSGEVHRGVSGRFGWVCWRRCLIPLILCTALLCWRRRRGRAAGGCAAGEGADPPAGNDVEATMGEGELRGARRRGAARRMRSRSREGEEDSARSSEETGSSENERAVFARSVGLL